MNRVLWLFVMVLLALGVVPAAAINVNLEVESRVVLESYYKDHQQLLPVWIAVEESILRLRGESPGQYSLRLDGLMHFEKSGTPTFGDRLPFHLQIHARPLSFDVWGGGMDIGSERVRSDPLSLLVFGSAGDRTWNHSGTANTSSAGRIKVATTVQLGRTPLDVQYFYRALHTDYLELYTETPIGRSGSALGGMLRYAITHDPKESTLTPLIFGKMSVFDNVTLSGSIGMRTGELVQDYNMAYGVRLDANLTPGATVISASYATRQKNFYDDLAQDASHQSGTSRYRNESSTAADGKERGSAFELMATWRGEKNRNRPLHEILHPSHAGHLARLQEPAYRVFVRLMEDGSKNVQTVAGFGAGAPLARNLYAVGELRYIHDEDGVNPVGGVHTNARYWLRGRVRYNLNALGWNNWFLLGTADLKRAATDAEEGYENSLGIELRFATDKRRITIALTRQTASNKDRPTDVLSGEFALIF